jgi:hypothetical protein
VSHVYWPNGRRAWTEDRRAYRCDWCGRVDRWNDDWSWYGSEADRENGDEHHLCSSTCVSKWSRLKCGGADGIEHPRALVLTQDLAVPALEEP